MWGCGLSKGVGCGGLQDQGGIRVEGMILNFSIEGETGNEEMEELSGTRKHATGEERRLKRNKDIKKKSNKIQKRVSNTRQL